MTTSKSQQVRNTTLYLLPVVLGNLVPLVTLPVFTRLLTTEDFGAWALANAYSVVIGGLATVGLPITYDRNFFEYRDGRQRSQLLYSVVAFSAASFAAFLVLTWVLRAPITGWLIGDLSYQRVLVWSLGAVAVANLKNFYLAFLRNSEQAAAFSMYTIGERLLSAGLTLAFVAWLRIGVVGLVVGQLLATLIVLIIMAARLLRTLPPAVDGRLLGDSLKLGLPLMPRVLFGVIGNNVDKYLIGQVASLGGVGIYSIGQRVAAIGFTYMTALQNVFGPQVYSRMFAGGATAGASIGRYLTPFAYASTVIVFLIAVFSEEILTVLAPAAYHGAIPIITILSLYYGIQFFAKMPQITYARKTHLLSVLSALSSALHIACGAAGIWLLGTVGAAWGVLTAGLILAMITFVVAQRCFRIEWESGPMTAIFGLLFASALVTIALRGLGVPYPTLLVVKLLAVTAFLWLGTRLHVLTAGNLALVRDLALRRGGPRDAIREARHGQNP